MLQWVWCINVRASVSSCVCVWLCWSCVYIWDLFGHNYTGALRFPVECWWEVGDGLSGITRVTDQQGFPQGRYPDYGETCERMARWGRDCSHCGFKNDSCQLKHSHNLTAFLKPIMSKLGIEAQCAFTTYKYGKLSSTHVIAFFTYCLICWFCHTFAYFVLYCI